MKSMLLFAKLIYVVMCLDAKIESIVWMDGKRPHGEGVDLDTSQSCGRIQTFIIEKRNRWENNCKDTLYTNLLFQLMYYYLSGMPDTTSVSVKHKTLTAWHWLAGMGPIWSKTQAQVLPVHCGNGVITVPMFPKVGY